MKMEKIKYSSKLWCEMFLKHIDIGDFQKWIIKMNKRVKELPIDMDGKKIAEVILNEEAEGKFNK